MVNMDLQQRRFGGFPLSVWMLAVVVFASIPYTESLDDSEKTAIEKGLETGKEILDVIKDKKFTKALTKIAGSIAPFLGVLGPFVSLILAFIPGGDSAELAFLKEMMKKIDNRFDQMDSRFDEIERLIDWTKVAVNFGQIEQRIMAMGEQYKDLYTSIASASNKSYIYIMNYENDYQNSGLKLYQAIVNPQGEFQENLGQSIMRYTKNDRKKTQEFLLGVMRLLLQAVKIEIAYLTVQGFETIAKERADKWKERILQVKSIYEQIDEAVRDNYHYQSKIDIKKIAEDSYGMSNKQFAINVNKMLKEKYYWRSWFVVIYNAITGSGVHYVSVCGGHILFREQGRNIVVASIIKNQDGGKRTVESAREQLNAVPKSALNIFGGGEWAKDIWGKIDKTGACSVIVIVSNADVWYGADSNKAAYRKLENVLALHLIMFGDYTSSIFSAINPLGGIIGDIVQIALQAALQGPMIPLE